MRTGEVVVTDEVPELGEAFILREVAAAISPFAYEAGVRRLLSESATKALAAR